MHVRRGARARARARVSVCACVRACVCVCVCENAQECTMCICMIGRVHVHACVRMCKHMHSRARPHVCACTCCMKTPTRLCSQKPQHEHIGYSMLAKLIAITNAPASVAREPLSRPRVCSRARARMHKDRQAGGRAGGRARHCPFFCPFSEVMVNNAFDQTTETSDTDS